MHPHAAPDPAELFPRATPAARLRGAPVCAIVVDAEEDFDWRHPAAGTPFSTACMHSIRDLHAITSCYGAAPTYLLTYPVLQDAHAVRLLRAEIGRGACDAGIQLHPWVTPPFDAAGATSFSGNLSAGLEERKLVALRALFIEQLGFAPAAYRAGRYGLGPHTASLLEEQGIAIDTSLAPRTTLQDEAGPDYRDREYGLFWFGRTRRLLEAPLCRTVAGWSGALAARLYRAEAGPQLLRQGLRSLLGRTRCAERLTLSPEGNDARAMSRLVRSLLARDQRMLSLSFHSSSLAAGLNPYVRSKRELHEFYDRLSETLDGITSGQGVRMRRLAEFPALLGGGAHG